MLIGAITGGIAGGIGTINFDNAYLEGLVTIGSGVLIGGGVSELTGGSFSQGAFIGGISAAASFALKQASSKAMSGGESSKKARVDITVNEAEIIEVNSTQTYGRGPESCGYWGELALNANDPVSGFLFERSEVVCKVAKTPQIDGFPKNWDRWVRTCLQDYHDAFSRFFGISRYTYTWTDFVGGHAACLTAPWWYSPTQAPAGAL